MSCCRGGGGGNLLDLGCGFGRDTQFLLSRGFNVVSADFSEIAIDKLNKNTKGSKGIVFDMENDDWKIFKTNEFDAVIANLSLHYFSTKNTHRIMREIKRIIKPNGFLIARVNSTKDFIHGAGEGEIIEKNFYVNPKRGSSKRFFDEEDVKEFFSDIGEISYCEKETVYSNKPKWVFEIVAVNHK